MKMAAFAFIYLSIGLFFAFLGSPTIENRVKQDSFILWFSLVAWPLVLFALVIIGLTKLLWLLIDFLRGERG